MTSPKLDPKNIGLVKLLYRLRQDIDLYRVIGLNVEALRIHGVSTSFWAHIQWLAHGSLALTTCKIFEHERRNDLNSIPGIIELFPSTCSSEQKEKIDRFALRFAVSASWTDAREYVRSVSQTFCSLHSNSLLTLKTFRDKFGAHSEHGAVLASLPAIAEYEALFEFADSFYRMVSDVLVGASPALVGAPVAVGTLSVMKRLGIESPKLDFDAPRA